MSRGLWAATEFNRLIRETIAEMIEDYLRRIPGFLTGRIGAGGLPPGTMIDRGSYSGTATYRPGDVVVSGGVVYVATAPATGIAPPDTAFWRPLGGTAGGAEVLTFSGDGLSWDGAPLYWG